MNFEEERFDEKEWKEELEKRVQYAEAAIRAFLPKEEGYAGNLAAAMNYSILAGGKRLRPVLMKEMYDLYGGRSDVICPFMAAMEMIHTHSLIHDDLPALDNDEYRRGKKTTHVVYGESAAILAGDALLNHAYETALKGVSAMANGTRERLPDGIEALKILAEKTGLKGMLGGQGVDVENNGKEMSRELLDFIYEFKTSALIEGAMMIGAVLAGAKELDKICEIGRNIGIAFQIQDDILDQTSSDEELGKPVGSDEKNKKTTYASLEGIEKASEEVKERTKKALKLLEELDAPGDKRFLSALICSLASRRK